MIEQAFDNLRKATEASIQVQKEMFQKWTSLFPMPTAFPGFGMPNIADEARKAQKRWEENVTELLRKQREAMDAQFNAGLKTLEDLFQLGQAKSPQEFQERVTELYKRSFESLRQLSEAQIKDFKAAADRWTETVTKPA